MVLNSETKPSLPLVSFCVYLDVALNIDSLPLGLSEAAMTSPLPSNLFHSNKAEEKPETFQSITLLELIAQVYESKILHPPMPYDPNALLTARMRLTLEIGRAHV